MELSPFAVCDGGTKLGTTMPGNMLYASARRAGYGILWPYPRRLASQATRRLQSGRNVDLTAVISTMSLLELAPDHRPAYQH